MHHAAIKNNEISTITKDLFIRALDDDERMFNKLLGYSVNRSFPIRYVTEEAAVVLQDTLQYGNVPLELECWSPSMF